MIWKELQGLQVETCFVSDQDDAKLYRANRNRVARAIVKAVLHSGSMG